jgi:hypothetical protein
VRGDNIDYTPTRELLARVVDLVAEGELHIPVEAEVPLHEAPAAIARSRLSAGGPPPTPPEGTDRPPPGPAAGRSGGARGKTVIRP